MPKVYIAGKVTGLDSVVSENNFNFAEDKLKRLGYEVINPLKLPHNHDKKWESYMKECIAELIKCDYIYMIDGWQSSRGACLEYFISQKLYIKTFSAMAKEKFTELYLKTITEAWDNFNKRVI